MPTTHTCPLVGSHFRPPAKAILAALPAGFPLVLRREPTNPYDPNAIQVILLTEELNGERQRLLATTLPAAGWTLDQVLSEPEWHLGFLASKAPKARAYSALAPELAPQLDAGAEVSGMCLGFDAAGMPQVKFTLQEADYEQV